ncbi:hypothetical protein ES707_05794 [subsurface metagenome]
MPSFVPPDGVPTIVLPLAAVYSVQPVGQEPAKAAIIPERISFPSSRSAPVKLISPETSNL